MLALPWGVGAPSSGNPGSATDNILDRFEERIPLECIHVLHLQRQKHFNILQSSSMATTHTASPKAHTPFL